jgi:high-affinity nickel permease
MHGRHESARHHRWLVHEFRLRLGFSQPVRKIDYKITVTALSAVISLVVGSIELLGLLADQFGWSGCF